MCGRTVAGDIAGTLPELLPIFCRYCRCAVGERVADGLSEFVMWFWLVSGSVGVCSAWVPLCRNRCRNRCRSTSTDLFRGSRCYGDGVGGNEEACDIADFVAGTLAGMLAGRAVVGGGAILPVLALARVWASAMEALR